jgi:molecular chaperone DnaJ
MAQRDYYEILGVAKDASQEEIRKAYLKLAHQHHPDKTGGNKASEDKLKEINEAYDTLKNPEKRSRYDAMGSSGFGDFASGFGGGGAAGFDAPFDDFFDVLFGGRGGRAGRGRAVRPGADLEYRATITLREAAKGLKKTIHFNRQEICPDCNGTGAAKGTQPVTCPDCGGSGQVRRSSGFFSVSQGCPRCRGTGRVVSDPCRRCGGNGTVRIDRELKIDLPAGIDTGQRLRVPGEGEPGPNGGPRGDLYILVEVADDELFERSGNDVACEIPISFPQAVLGDKIRVPTLDGEADLKIPAGTQSGTLFRLRGLGIPDVRGYHRGDQIVRVQVETPTKLTREQRDLILKFQELSTEQTYPLHLRFLDKIKKSFTG